MIRLLCFEIVQLWLSVDPVFFFFALSSCLARIISFLAGKLELDLEGEETRHAGVWCMP
jgi:hypothetical protein